MPRTIIDKPSLEERVDERRNSRTFCQDDQAAKEEHHQHEGQQPEFLPYTHELPKFENERHADILLELFCHAARRRRRAITWNPVARRRLVEF